MVSSTTGPEKGCDNLFQRHKLEYRAVLQVEDSRVDATVPAMVMEILAKVQAAIDRYHIHDSRYILNMDQSGSSFEKIIGRSLRKSVGVKGENFFAKNDNDKRQLGSPHNYACGVSSW